MKALDADGTLVLALGTLGFALATAMLWFQRAGLDADGRGWWVWVGVAGTLLGLVGWLAARLRRRRRRGPA